MTKHNQDGAISGVAVSLVFTILLLIGALGFGGWAFSGRQDYKNNADAKITAASAIAVQKANAAKDAQFAQEVKQPLKTYNGPEAFGSLIVNYPKTWSAYVNDTGSGNVGVDGYFAPGAVPSISDDSSVFALRVQVLSQSYAGTVQSFAGQQQSGKLTISAYSLPKLPKVVGVEVTGQLASQTNKTTVTMVVLPIRSATLEIWTEGSQYLGDFNNNILPNFSFSP